MVTAYTEFAQAQRYASPTPTVETHQGGTAYAVGTEQRLQRFLILGSEGGSFYVSEKELTKQNALVVEQALAENAMGTVDTIVEVSRSGRAIKNEPALLALAIAASWKGGETQEASAAVRSYALSQLPYVARTGTHLFHFVSYVDAMRGWGSSLRKGVAGWYTALNPRDLAYQITKYQKRDNWTHRDLLRLSHPTPPNDTYDAIFKYVTSGELDVTFDGDALEYLATVEYVKSGKPTKQEVITLIRERGLPREVIPTQLLNDPDVWEALLYAGKHGMPMNAMIRNLGNMSKIGLLVPHSDASRFVASKLTNEESIKFSRLHPVDLVKALFTYRSGRSVKGSGEWTPVPSIVTTLERGFELSFGNVEPTNKRTNVYIDVSGSMTWHPIGGIPGFTPREASAVMAMVTVRAEQDAEVYTFSNGKTLSDYYKSNTWGLTTGIAPLNVFPTDSLQQVVDKVSDLWAGGTDCALPMKHAIKHRKHVDAFIVYTDSETGGDNPSDALREYRAKMGIADAKLIVVGMVANEFSIADPQDTNMLDVVGFDTAAPQAMSMFIRGEV